VELIAELRLGEGRISITDSGCFESGLLPVDGRRREAPVTPWQTTSSVAEYRKQEALVRIRGSRAEPTAHNGTGGANFFNTDLGDLIMNVILGVARNEFLLLLRQCRRSVFIHNNDRMCPWQRRREQRSPIIFRPCQLKCRSPNRGCSGFMTSSTCEPLAPQRQGVGEPTAKNRTLGKWPLVRFVGGHRLCRPRGPHGGTVPRLDKGR